MYYIFYIVLDNNLLLNQDIFNMLKNKKMHISNFTECCEIIFLCIREIIGNKPPSIADDFEIGLKNRIKGFVTTLYKKWSSAGRNLTTFKVKNRNWLELNFNIFGEIKPIIQPSTNRGRPKKLFAESCERSKKRKEKNLAPGSTTLEMAYATYTRINKSGKRAAAKIIIDATTSIPKSLRRVKRAYKPEKKN